MEPALEGLRDRFLSRSGARVEELLQLIDAVSTSNLTALAELHRKVHSLGGLGTTYGFPEVTRLARLIEHEAAALMDSPVGPPSSTCDRWRDLVGRIAEDFTRVRPMPETAATPSSFETTLDILLASADPELSSALRQRLAFGDREMRTAMTMAEVVEAISSRSPDIMITSVDLPGGSGYQAVEALRAAPGGEVPFAAVLVSQDHFPDKVEAIRCGADVVLVTTALDELAQRIDAYLDLAVKPPARILVVEDDPEQAAFNESVLRSGGSDVLVCSDTQTYEQDLYTFMPDLIVMDIVMPGISGHDLARFTRQNKRFATTPILFLTSQTDLQTRIQSVKSGGDEHLVKPVSPGLLLATAASRIERARQLQSLLEHDGLTGLLTHSAFAERLRQAWLARRRHPRAAVLVMLDIDEFKKVNDQYGHGVGDRVLYSLAALLKRRLRQTDSIGRYGGEEFAILLEDLSAPQAERLIDLLRVEFADSRHELFGGEPFHVTFSCGLASLTSGDETLESWKLRADEALYVSKRNGRNRVSIAGGSA